MVNIRNNLYNSPGSTPTNLRFTGQQQAPELGLYDYGARFYDPALGRFIQPDTIIPNPGNTMDWDRYTYSRNNPIIYCDPTGHMPAPCAICSILTQLYQKTMQTIGRTFVYQNTEADSAPDLMVLAFFQEPSATITGDGLDAISNDKTMQEKQNEYIKDIMADSRYGREDFSQDFGIKSITFGEMGNNNMIEDALQSQTWTVRAANVKTSVNVSKAGDIKFDNSLSDTLDLVPDWDSGARTGISGFFYNVTTSFTGAVWHGLLGARKIETRANWTTYYYKTNLIEEEEKKK